MTINMTIKLLQRPALLGAAFVGLALLTASAAQAFTFEDQGTSTNSGGGAQHYKDLDLGKPSSRLDDSGNKTVIKRGNSSFYFNGPAQSFDQRNNPNDYFNPNYLTGR
jgi:hypothetical protein